MAYRSFRNFIDDLEKAGELKRIAVPVDTDLLIAEWADREMKSPGGGKALLFEQPIVDGKKSDFPVAINTMGSRRRMAMALQVADIEEIARVDGDRDRRERRRLSLGDGDHDGRRRGAGSV